MTGIEQALLSIAEQINDRTPQSAASLTGRSTATGSIANATFTDIIFKTTDYDENGEMNLATSEFTCTSKGMYVVDAMVSLESTSGSYRYILVAAINGNQDRRLEDKYSVGGGVAEYINGSSVIKLDVGDIVTVQLYHAVGSTRTYYGTTEDSTPERNYFNITQVQKLAA